MKWLAAVCCRPDLLAVVWLMNWRCANRPLPSPILPPPPASHLSLFLRPPTFPSRRHLLPSPSPHYYIYSFLRYNSSGECSSFHLPPPSSPLFSFIIVSTGNCHFPRFFFNRSLFHGAPFSSRTFYLFMIVEMHECNIGLFIVFFRLNDTIFDGM